MQMNLSLFEGMHIERRLFLPLLLCMMVVGFLADGVVRFLCLLVGFLVAVFLVIRLYQRTTPRWGRIFHPAMVRFSTFGGHVTAIQSQQEHTDVSAAFREVLEMMVGSIYPELSREMSTEFVSNALQKLSSGYDKHALRQMIRRFKSRSPEEEENLLSRLVAELSSPDNHSAQVRFVIAEIVERELGLLERSNYVQHVALNRI